MAQCKVSAYWVIIMFSSRILIYKKLDDMGRESVCGTIHKPLHFSKNATNFLLLQVINALENVNWEVVFNDTKSW